MIKLQQTIYKCDKFTTSAFCDNMKLHGEDVDNESIAKYLLFGNVLPLTGAGHFEMKMLKGFFKIHIVWLDGGL